MMYGGLCLPKRKKKNEIFFKKTENRLRPRFSIAELSIL